MTILNKLFDIENKLPELLQKESSWNSILIDYHPPIVERLYLQMDDIRINLHLLHPYNDNEALFHPHPWPSAMRILSGKYEMGIGFSEDEAIPSLAAKLILPRNTAYEMSSPGGWHYVRPLRESAYSLMISGRPWERSKIKVKRSFCKLSKAKKTVILDFFKGVYLK